MPGDEVDYRAGHGDEPTANGGTDRRPDGVAGGAGGPAVEWLARRLGGGTGERRRLSGGTGERRRLSDGTGEPRRPAHAREDDHPADEWVDGAEYDHPADEWVDRGEDDHPAEAWVDGGEDHHAGAAPMAGAADVGTDDTNWLGDLLLGVDEQATLEVDDPAATRPEADEPTGEWPAPGTDDWAEEDTDPTGFAPVYGPPSDPFVEDDDAALPGWGAPPPDEHAAVGRRRILVVTGVFLALAGLIGVTLLAGRDSGEAQQAAGRGSGGGVAAGDQGGSPVSAPVAGRTSATFELVDGAGAVQVRAGDLGDDLYRISTPAGSGVTPKVVDEGGSLRVFLPSGAHGGATAVDILLSTAVRWSVRLHGGANSTRIDLNGAQVDAVDLEGGANRIDLALPAPKAVTAVRMSGGVDQFFVRLAGGTPVRVRVQDGAGRVTLAGDTQTGIAPGREFTAFGWTPGGSGVDLTAAAGMSGLTVSLG